MQHNPEETMALIGCRCGCNFFRQTVYHGIYFMDKCPRCNGKDLKIIERDVTKIWSVNRTRP